ncbi:hypothetical protein VTN02DRAFT_5428 [Thermoascus thermophilus]
MHMKIDALAAEMDSRHAPADGKGKDTRSGGKGRHFFTKTEAGSAKHEGMKGSVNSKAGEPSAEGVSRINTPPTAEQSQSDVPTPTAAFRTPSECGGDEQEKQHGGDCPDKQRQKKGSLRSAVGSTGSPESKKASSCSHFNTAPQAAPSSVSPVHEDTETPDKSGSMEMKTPRKRGVFGIGRRRDGDSQNHSRFPKTPIRNKESKGLLILKKDNTLPAVPPGVLLPSAPQGAPPSTSNYPPHERTSPGSIHPALRNPHQQQIMREHEQHQNWYQSRRGSRHGSYPRRPSHGGSGYGPQQSWFSGPNHSYNSGFGYGSSMTFNQMGSNPYINPPPMAAGSYQSTPITPWPVGPSGPCEGNNWYHDAYNNDTSAGRK